jgi:hypothetical protein
VHPTLSAAETRDLLPERGRWRAALGLVVNLAARRTRPRAAPLTAFVLLQQGLVCQFSSMLVLSVDALPPCFKSNPLVLIKTRLYKVL